MAAVVLVALLGSAAAQRPLPLSSFTYPSAPLLPIAPLADYGDVYQRRVEPSSIRVSPRITASRPISLRNEYATSGSPCNPSPCGKNTWCEVSKRKRVAICRCNDGFIPIGHTINGCKPECERNSDCSKGLMCDLRTQKCEQICKQNSNVCGINAECIPGTNYEPVCKCPIGYGGNPHIACTYERIDPQPLDIPDPCLSRPCGPNAICNSISNKAVCECPSGYDGDPLIRCNKLECVRHQDCTGNPTHACKNNRCLDPCSLHGICGVNSECTVRNRQPVCSCPVNYDGDPLTRCDRVNLCDPSPCGPKTNCNVRNNRAECSCYSGYIGDPLKGCRLECERDRDCQGSFACVNYKCVNPCAGNACGEGALCDVRNGAAVCSCPRNYIGNPHSRCYPECTRHEDCPRHLACSPNLSCENPCTEACGTDAECRVEDHKAICSCPRDHTGDPFVLCRKFRPEELCIPNPCGTNAECNPGFDKQGNNRPVCTCPRGYVGDPLIRCNRGECFSNDECPSHRACYKYKCQSTCEVDFKSVCGTNAECNMKNHRPVCSCPRGYTGNPLSRCDAAPLRYIVGRARSRSDRFW